MGCLTVKIVYNKYLLTRDRLGGATLLPLKFDSYRNDDIVDPDKRNRFASSSRFRK